MGCTRIYKRLSVLPLAALAIALMSICVVAQEGSASDPRRPLGPDDQIGSAPKLPYWICLAASLLDSAPEMSNKALQLTAR